MTGVTERPINFAVQAKCYFRLAINNANSAWNTITSVKERTEIIGVVQREIRKTIRALGACQPKNNKVGVPARQTLESKRQASIVGWRVDDERLELIFRPRP